MKAIRISRGYSQFQFAQLLGMSQSVVSSWELGRSAPDLGTLFQISRALHEPVTRLLPLEDSPMDDDRDQRILDIIHQDQRWMTLFSRHGKMSEAAWTAVFSVLDAFYTEPEDE